MNSKRKCFPDGLGVFILICGEYTVNKHRLNVRDFTSVKSMKVGEIMMIIAISVWETYQDGNVTRSRDTILILYR